ncbi:hypothetical protein QG516_19110 [Pedobacter gandavensis]|nr:hypothetical protein [Pedobacter gandavensis]WGQ12596.1 hypothetical protein QG516_19110 [Pedobacter gandavensis]
MFTTDDELYKAYSEDEAKQSAGATKQTLIIGKYYG